MLNLLDAVIEKVLDVGWVALPKPTFAFSIPDEDWKKKVAETTAGRLNIYLYETRENRDYRRADWDVVTLADRSTAYSHPPVYLDAHYLISAWSPMADTEGTNPTLEEHRLLAEALRILFRNPEVTPASVGGIVGGGPVFQQANICLTVVTPEVPRVLNDFWSTMKMPWRPAIQLTATAPLDLLQDVPTGPLVTTFIQRYAVNGGAAVDEFVIIGGLVLKNADDSPIAGATVRRLDTGESVVTDTQGRFSFAGLKSGIHRLRVEAAGMAAVERDLDLPSAPAADHIFKLS